MDELREYLHQNRIKQNAFAAKMRVTPPTVTRWVNGEGKPSYEHMVTIERITEGAVPLGAWATPADEKRRA